MREYVGNVSTKGQVTLPADLREKLGIRPGDKVVMVLEPKGVLLRRAQMNLMDGYRSIPALKHPRSLEEIRQIAAEEHAQEAAREGLPQA